MYNDYNQSKCSMSKPVDFPVNDDWHWLAGGGGFGGGCNFKTSPFLGGKFFSGKKHEGGQIL